LPAWLLFLLTALTRVFLRLTRFGRHVCAVGSNERVARYAAINTALVSFSTYAIVGLMAGLGGLLLGGRLSALSSTTAGLGYELDAIAAAIIGGTAMSGGKGSLSGTLAGVLILGIIANVLVMWGVSANLQDTVKGAVIIAAVLLQRKGNK
ncbi:MAG: ribose ABC transporter permease, partial [Victivallales bacterium]|nr:ribose ABC transporter permease [Victivallales bacterium]